MKIKKIRSDCWQPTKIVTANIIELYNDGASAKDLSQKYGVADMTITSLLKRAVFLSIYSNRICDKLAEYGIVPRKSKIAEIPESMKNNRHFWRGMIDGDGWVSLKMLGLCGTLSVVSSFRQFIEDLGLILNINIPRVVISMKTNFCYECRYQGRYTKILLSHLYQSDDISLNRKNMNIICV